MFGLSVSPSRHSISEWRMQSIARDSEESSDEEFFDAHGNRSFNVFISLGLQLIVRLIVNCVQFSKKCLLPFFPDSACISLTTDQFLSFPDTQHALGLQLKQVGVAVRQPRSLCWMSLAEDAGRVSHPDVQFKNHNRLTARQSPLTSTLYNSRYVQAINDPRQIIHQCFVWLNCFGTFYHNDEIRIK